MTDPVDTEAWLDRLSKRVAAVSDHRQRQALFLEAILPLTAVAAGNIVGAILGRGIRRRDMRSLLLVETAMLALACGKWPSSHRSVIRDAAFEQDDELMGLLFDDEEEVSSTEEDPFPVPDYTGGRPLTLGERRSLAAGPNRRLLEMASRDPHPMVISRVLDNPRITENDVVYIAARRPAPPEALRAVAMHAKWRLSKRVSRALVLNPYTPSKMSITLLHMIPFLDYKEIMNDFRLSTRLRRVARELFRRYG